MTRRFILCLPLLAALAGCAFGGPRPSDDDREAVTDCKQQSDRIFATRNRYQLSERDSSDTPFSGNNLPSNPSAGLDDQYQRDQLLDDCLNRSAAGDTVVRGTTPSGGAH